MTVLGGRDLAPTRRHRHRRGPLRALLALLLIAGLAGGGYLVFNRVFDDPTGDTVTQPAATACPSPSGVPGRPNARDVTVRVLNTTKENGLASRISKALAKRGFATTKTANAGKGAPRTGPPAVIHGPDQQAAAELVAQHLPEARLVLDTDRSEATVDLIITADYRKLLGPADVAARLAAPASASPALTPDGRCR